MSVPKKTVEEYTATLARIERLLVKQGEALPLDKKTFTETMLLDLAETKALVVTADKDAYHEIFTSNFKLVLAFAWGADMFIDIHDTNPNSPLLPAGYAFKISRREKVIARIHAKAVSGSGVLYLTFWR